MGALGNLIPLVILFVFVGFAAYIGYQMYVFANELKDRGVKKMEKKNVIFTKDGMKVGVKEVKTEEYADKTQSIFVKAWSYASFPAYKSRLGWNTSAEQPKKASSASSSSRPAASRSASSITSKSQTKS
ncbi:hypothetical protein K432DRAFT_378514 [Lepidopterella palustris CBS 459.81]|uniref:Uncharacterized protein n=1 Tax=Lepidopterella palustris CBS 459.81 TaxID=1314670 RepID=A0A8E2JJP0_9PEZI|nr:hypothetical protein K432DRAFT_378514 [Lepidopterella palustris CBS 459.81]